jgi:cytochrome c-type biogenesis protein
MDSATLLWLTFLAGVYAPIGSPCVLVLYPGYLAFLAGTGEDRGAGSSAFSLGVAVAAGVILAFLLGGILFGVLLSLAGPAVREILTPALVLLLLVFSLLLLLDRDPAAPFSVSALPRVGSPHGSALLFGLGAGILILPCNSAIILFLLASAVSAPGAFPAAGLFLAFGAGVTLPLILLAGISRIRSGQVVGFLTIHRQGVRRIAGLLMLGIALWYLFLILVPGTAG